MNCPHCNTNLSGSPIPKEHQSNGEEFYSRKIGVEIMGVYDGVLYWECPDCGGRWHRWPGGHELRRRAEKYVM